MTEPSKPKDTDEVCPMCKRPKSRHTSEEMLACDRKMMEFKKQKDGGAGIQQEIIKLPIFLINCLLLNENLTLFFSQTELPNCRLTRSG